MIKIPFQILSAKAPDEDVTVGIGFSKRIPAGATISACVFTVSVWEGGPDADTATMPEGTADLSAAPMMRQVITGGLDGTDYLVQALITLSTGQQRVGSVILPVRKGGS